MIILWTTCLPGSWYVKNNIEHLKCVISHVLSVQQFDYNHLRNDVLFPWKRQYWAIDAYSSTSFYVVLFRCIVCLYHYSAVMMSAMASQITGVSIVCATVCSGTDEIKHQSAVSLKFLRRWNKVETLRWHPNGCDSVSNHQPHNCLLNRLFSRGSKKTSKLRVTGLCAGNSPATGEFPAQMASNAENVSVWWRHHEFVRIMCLPVMAFVKHRLSIAL